MNFSTSVSRSGMVAGKREDPPVIRRTLGIGNVSVGTANASRHPSLAPPMSRDASNAFSNVVSNSLSPLAMRGESRAWLDGSPQPSINIQS